MKTLNWSEVPFNPWLQKLNHRMLEDKFSVERDITKMKLGAVRITFGRDFVVQYIAQVVIKPLMISSSNDWQRLAGEAWRAYRDGEKQNTKSSVLVSPPNGETESNEAG